MKRICRNFIICSSTFLQEAFDKCDSGYFRGDNMVEPRVLVVSHNVFSSSGNMGKTMMHMLAGIPPDNLAQLYFHQEIPTRRCCLHYFRMTDSNILHSLFSYKKQSSGSLMHQTLMNRRCRAEPTQAGWRRYISFPDGVHHSSIFCGTQCGDSANGKPRRFWSGCRHLPLMSYF